MEINESRPTPDPCVQIQCVFDRKNNATKLKNLQTRCNEECEAGFEYHKMADDATCCGECVQKQCVLDGSLYTDGEHWKSDDNCTLYECAERDGLLEISSFRKSCPTLGNCEPESIYTKDCCQFCNETKRRQLAFDNEPSPSEVAEEGVVESYASHPCARNCIADDAPKTCEYTFLVRAFL